MDKNLFGLGHHLWVFLEQGLTLTLIYMQPRIFLVDLPIEKDAADNAKQKFHSHPNVEILVGIGQKYLQSNLYQVGRLHIHGCQIVLLVGREQYLAVVDEIADE